MGHRVETAGILANREHAGKGIAVSDPFAFIFLGSVPIEESTHPVMLVIVNHSLIIHDPIDHVLVVIRSIAHIPLLVPKSFIHYSVVFVEELSPSTRFMVPGPSFPPLGR